MHTSHKAIFLDRDGTIIADSGYPYKIEDLKFLPRAIEGLKRLYEDNFLLVIITNQSGIGRGFFSKAEYEVFTSELLLQLKKNDILIAGCYYCPHVEKDHCDCRKPHTKLFYDAKNDLDLDFSQSFAIGDKLRDLCICNEEPVRGILIGSRKKKSSSYPIVHNLNEAALLIEKLEKGFNNNGNKQQR